MSDAQQQWDQASDFTSVAIDQLVESPTNPRKTFGEKALGELARSIVKHGILQPLVVRPQPGGGSGFELVVGARRLRAAKLAKLEFVPVRIRSLSDGQVLEIQIVENVQRAGVHPLEEAAGYRALQQSLGYDVATIAEKVGKSGSYVYQRLKLADLSKPARQALLDKKITAGHAILIARLGPADQKSALTAATAKWRPLSVRALNDWIAEEIHRDLRKAPFAQTDAELVPAAGACRECPKRAGNNRTLFPDVKRPDTCTDPGCYESKVVAHLGREIERAKGAGDALVRISSFYSDAAVEKSGVLTSNQYQEAAGKRACPSAARAIYIDGENRGRETTICIDPKCPTHGRNLRSGVSAESAKEQAKRLAAEKKLKVEREFRLRVLAAILERAPDKLSGAELRAVALGAWERLYHDHKVPLARRRGWEPVKEGYSQNYGIPAAAWLEKARDQEVIGFLLEVRLWPLTNPGHYYVGAGSLNSKKEREELLDWARRYKVPLRSLEREPAAAVVEKPAASPPKSKPARAKRKAA